VKIKKTTANNHIELIAAKGLLFGHFVFVRPLLKQFRSVCRISGFQLDFIKLKQLQ
jgi:hypothetical protein